LRTLKDHLITKNTSVKDVLKRLDILASDAILFLIDEEEKLIGSLTDGDIRRGLINDLTLDHSITSFVKGNPKYFSQNEFSLVQMKEWREKNFKIVPVVNSEMVIVDIVNFRTQKSYLPIDAVIMAGGRGTRLMPLTENTPKPLIEVGGKYIIEYNIDRLKNFGIKNQTISINYLGEQIQAAFGDGTAKNIQITYTHEKEVLGTMGALSLVDTLSKEYVIVMNSDLLTDIDFEDMLLELLTKDADMAMATTVHEVQIPYGIIESNADGVTSIQEKPTYSYHSNAGIYMFKKELVSLIPKDTYFDATQFVDVLLAAGKKVIDYPILGYWLDIGKPQDLEKAQRDIHHLKL
jgi:dTDP-glucose pyrophosphorylase